ncbi:pectinesterase-like [Punica granatum]|uniref:Pectinesterase n=2 Tax=Punica granatum TaxID=22663 RepID=A0A218W511_PUNGR|nr:pectinesterase-like [Punica granatum]OWM67390.1 hypothetical protein CDL15_Pgr000842 [Punica granatum]PKI43092.1 hypothetical protein CRG98_036571 [Punica granatum]
MKVGKLVAAGISILLVVGVCIGVIVGVAHKNNSGDGKGISSTSKSVAAICDPTDYKEACINSLSVAAKNGTTDPKELIVAAFGSALKEVQASLSKSGTIGEGAKAPQQKMAFDDCKELLQYAIDELQASYSMVGDSSLHTMNDRVSELQNWLSAVISYQQTCVDGVTQQDLKNQIQTGLLNATQLTSNALAIVSAISGILTTFNIPAANNSASSRKLLEETEEDRDGYPSWFSVADRRLMAAQAKGQVTPNAIVAKDGSGKYNTIAAALASVPKKNKGRYVIYVKAGVYNEYLTVTKDQTNVFMYGDGPRKSVITGKKSFTDGITTYKTASFSTMGYGFIAKAMGFQNTAGPQGHQAVAVRVQADMAAFFNCRMDGYQDTLYVQTHRQFYRNCVISGTIDFIFGDASAVIQNSLIIVRKPMDKQQNTVTAQGRIDKHETTGLVIHNCRIVPDQQLYPVRLQVQTYLGRPWKGYSRTVIMESTLGDLIQPAGWMPWSGNFALDTLYYAEYANRGPGANTANRVKWKGFKVINRNEALQFTAGPFLQGNQWLKATGVPYLLSLRA